MSDFLTGSSVFAVILTLAAYQVGLFLQKKWRSPLCNPILIAVILVMITLLIFDVPNTSYQKGSVYLNYLLTPATICLAVPLYQQIQILRRHWLAILLGILAGSLTCLVMIIVFAGIFRFDHTLFVSLLPKSVTTAMGMALSEQAGGIGAITTAAIIVTGILGSLAGLPLARLLKIDQPIAMGVAFGTSAHVIGTAKANESSELAGAVSSLSLVIAGILTAIVFPLLVQIY
ncbi:MAG TPA: hypothetical protein DCM45_05005 [Clostridiales bacterium]|nr:hypothetical protein [Clostridiales bacterium]